MGLAAPKIVHFTELERWDVKFFMGRIKSKYPLVPLSELVTEHNEKIRPYEDPEKIFKILGVNNTDGIFHAYDAKGKAIKQPYKKVKAGDFAYNPYRINVGSIGWVPPEHDGAYISPAYVVFSIDVSNILPELFWIIMKSEFFNQALRAATAGSVRMNLTYPLLQTLKVPIPPITIQKKIVAYSKKSMSKVHLLENQAKNVMDEFTLTFIKNLGLKIPLKREPEKTFVAQWQNFDRWSVSYNQASMTMMSLSKGNYPIFEIGTIVDIVQYGTSEKTNSYGEGVGVIRMNNIVDGELDLTDMKYLSVSKEVEKNLKLLNGDILFNRTNSKELVGKCAVFDKKETYIFASYLIRLRVNSQKANPYFIAFSINSPIGRQQIDALSRQIIGQANINSQEIRSLKLPLPDIEIQHKLANDINDIRQKSTGLKIDAKALYQREKANVEQMILGFQNIEKI